MKLMKLRMNDASRATTAGANPPARQHGVAEESLAIWARQNLARTVCDAEHVALDLADPLVQGEDRKMLKAERIALLSRIAAMRRLL